MRISLTVVDTPGFGDGIDNEYRYVCCFADLVSVRLTRDGELTR